MEIDYTFNRKDGEVHLNIDYYSPTLTSPPDHDEQHFDLVKQVLERSGMMAGSGACCVRINRDDLTTVWRVTKQGSEYHWERINECETPAKEALEGEPPENSGDEEAEKGKRVVKPPDSDEEQLVREQN
jgi:hypothetical protein